MEYSQESSVIDFLCNKTILVTGATGFLAKILVEKLLRVQPKVGKLFLLIRDTPTKSTTERLHEEILSKDLFRVLRERHGTNFDGFISEKVLTIEGNTSLPDLGLNINDLHMCQHQIHAIIHVAASTNFTERYDVALGINTWGAKNMMEFGKKCPNLQVLVHISTAYVCGEAAGKVVEQPCKRSEYTSNTKPNTGLDIEEEDKLVHQTLKDLSTKDAPPKQIRHAMKTLGHQRAKLYGWPNTYVFTKAMGEMLIMENREDLPVVIIRPTMVSSTYKDPFPGWVEGFGSVAPVSIVYGKGLVNFMHADGNTVFDLIPADMVVNSILMGMVRNAKRPSCLSIYQVGSSLRNPLTFRHLLDTNFRYFNHHPWTNTQGLPVKIRRGILVKSKVIFIMLLAIQLLKVLVLKAVDIVTCHHSNHKIDELEMQLKATVKVSQIFAPYLFFTGIFDDESSEKLRSEMTKDDKNSEEWLDFDPKCIDWDDYLFNAHIPAIVKYLF